MIDDTVCGTCGRVEFGDADGELSVTIHLPIADATHIGTLAHVANLIHAGTPFTVIENGGDK